MDLLVNDLSLHGQFPDVQSFQEAVGRVMEMRQIASRFGREVHCHRNIANAQATHGLTVLQATQCFPLAERRVVLSWLTKLGPFWEDFRVHSADDYLEAGGAIVTDSALGEAAVSRLRGTDRRVVSVSPSDWTFSPVSVSLENENGTCASIDVINYFQSFELERALTSEPTAIGSWEEVRALAVARCCRLRFANDAFDSLQGHPFVHGAAHRIIELLHTLDEIRGCMDEKGQLSPEGERLYQSHFVGKKAWFSDSSDDEYVDFKAELTFRHPENAGQKLLCGWHGKVKWPQIRIHFLWPVPVNESLYVVYVGPKITKR